MNTNEPEIRNNIVNIKLTDAEEKLINAYVTLTGKDKSTLLREILVEQARIVLGNNK